MAVKVRMGFAGLLDVIFVMGALLYFIIDSIPRFVEYYTDKPHWLGIPLLFFFCMFLWRVGNMIMTFVQTYIDMRDLYMTVVVTAKDVHGKIVMGGQTGTDED